MSELSGCTARLLEGRIRVDLNARRLAEKYGYRPYMVSRYLEMFKGEGEVEELLRSFDKVLNPVVRCNTLKTRDCSELQERLSRHGYILRPVEWVENAYEVVRESKTPSLGSTHEHLLGMYYLYRGRASLLPPVILSPSQEDVVADVAAAPGGKTTHMAQLMRNMGAILAVEPVTRRLKVLRNNVERLGVRNAVILKLDGRRVGEVFKGYFSKALLDAPCTGEGVIMMDPSRKTRTALRDLIRHHEAQVKLLNAALNSLRKGGRLLYTTCSIAPEEDELVVSEVLGLRSDVRVIGLESPLKLSPPITDYYNLHVERQVRLCGRTYPHVHGMEGFFLCLLERVAR
ncbi:MAG: RsmB/NOP family class I SAM-dependent RNA methyltransferase [Zestosphaera sp.]